MAKKGDILVKIYSEFPEYLENYKARLKELEREFSHAKNDFQSYIEEIDKDYYEKEKKLRAGFMQIEKLHHENINQIESEFTDRFGLLQQDVSDHNEKTQELVGSEENLYDEILTQFEDRKAEAFNNYLNLTKETEYNINREMRVHSEFVDQESEKLEEKKLAYQELNSNLSNQLIWTMEKAKNSLGKLNSSLIEEGSRNQEYLADVINDSLSHLNASKEAMSALFKTTSIKFEKERNRISQIRQEKRKPHSELNQRMIQTFVKQIREVNESQVAFEQMIKRELELSLSRLYPKIIEADSKNDADELKKLILQKEIIEKKVDYLLNRNQTMTDLLIVKYQNEIKKIKIDSFKRSEEIKLAYSVPVAFFQNSVNIYSNFAFYLNETYEDLIRMLMRFKEFNEEYISIRANYIHGAQKTFEDYKINLLVKVNNLTNQLTEYITEIDNLSHEIVTLESNNRLEIAEIRKKMENLEIFGDYQKYIAQLENDQYFAMFQHNKNLEKIQVESNYTNNLLNINKEVLLLNQNKLEFQEYQEYMLRVAEHEKTIQEFARERHIAETKAKYKQRIDQVLALSKIAHERIVYNARKHNFDHAATYMNYVEETEKKNNLGSIKIIDYIKHAQDLIDLNAEQTSKIREYLSSTEDNYAYLRALEMTRDDLLKQVDKTTEKKNRICITACDLYEQETKDKLNQLNNVFNKYLLLLKEDLLKLNTLDTDMLDSLDHFGYREEMLSVINYVYQQLVGLAYKYQIPKAVKSLDESLELYLEKFIIKNITTFKRISKHPKQMTELLKTYFIETISLMEEYQEYSQTTLNFILENTTKNDRLFIVNSLKKSVRTKFIINKEYNVLEYKAFKVSKSKKRQLKLLEKHSENLNEVYKKQVSEINNEYLAKIHETDQITGQIAKKFTRVIKRNNRELAQMLKFLDSLFAKEKKQLDIEYQRFQKSIKHIELTQTDNYEQELVYIKSLYQSKDAEASKTIGLLETKINTLPVDKDRYYLESKREKHELVASKGKELQRRMAEIERDKFVSRPQYLEEIEAIKKRLPNDYVALYNRIQELEFDYLNHFTNINEQYMQNYKEFLLNQSGNNEVIERDSKLYAPFVEMHSYNDKIINATAQTYKETVAKSKKTREGLNKDAQQSNEKQKRIINV